MQATNFEILEMVHEGRIDARTGAELMEAAEQCPSTEEALRILRMFRENKVTLDEAKELLIAMGRPELEERPREAALVEEKGRWPGLARWQKIALAVSAGIVLLVFLFFATDFGGIFTPGGKYAKLVRFGILAFAAIISTIAYFLARRRGEMWLLRPTRKKAKLALTGKAKVTKEKAGFGIAIASLILFDAICILFTLWLVTTSGWCNLLVYPRYYLRHFLNWFSPWALVITGIYILSFTLFGLYGKKGRSLVRIFCAVALPLLLFWLIQHTEQRAVAYSYHIVAPSLNRYYAPAYKLSEPLPKSPRDYYITFMGHLSHFSQKLLFSGLLCFFLVAGYRRLFFTRLTREKAIEVEASG